MNLDPKLVELYESGPEDEEVSAILRLRDGADPPPNVRVVAQFERIFTIRVPRRLLLETRQRPEVLSAKAAYPMLLPKDILEEREADDGEPYGDDANAEAGSFEPAPALAAQSWGPEDGTGCVVGLCDWGIDFTHPNFRNADGSTRLEALWDQRGTGSPLAPEPYGYGRLLTADRINAALAQPDPIQALDYDPSLGGQWDAGSHGTCVADICVGNRREPGSKVGLASGARFIFVHLGSQRMQELENLGDSVNLLEAFDFIRRLANCRPCVINVSAGRTFGTKRAESPLERAVDAMVLDPCGPVLCQSVGNYGDSAMHTHFRLGPEQTYTVTWLIPAEDRTPNALEIWYSNQDVFDVTLVAPSGETFPVKLGDRLRMNVGGEIWGNLYHRLNDPNSPLNQFAAYLYRAAPTGAWQVVVQGREVVDGRLQSWIERDAGNRDQSRFLRSQATSRYTTNTICNCFRAIAVGAYDSTRSDRPAAHFSSQGPTADGRTKPEIVAPGCRILAARSRPSGGWSGDEPKLVLKDGTSMSAPFVTGCVALMMQAAKRRLTIHEVRRILIGTADPHGGASGGSSSKLGYGYLNIPAAVAAARRLGAGEVDVPFRPLSVSEVGFGEDAAHGTETEDHELEEGRVRAPLIEYTGDESNTKRVMS